jgi:competence protein ComGF
MEVAEENHSVPVQISRLVNTVTYSHEDEISRFEELYTLLLRQKTKNGHIPALRNVQRISITNR